MRYDLTDLKLFMAIAQAGNLSRASQARHLTPSAASQRLRNLEQALGCQLFTREHKGMRLTEEGHAMLEHARGIFAAIDGMEAEAALLGSSLQGKATLAAQDASHAGEVPQEGDGPSCRFFDTLSHAFVGMALTSSNYAFLREIAKRHGRPLRCRIHVDDFTSIVRLVSQGVGLAIIPHSIYRRLGTGHAVACLPLEETWARRPLQLVRSSERPLTPTAQRLRVFLKGLADEA